MAQEPQPSEVFVDALQPGDVVEVEGLWQTVEAVAPEAPGSPFVEVTFTDGPPTYLLPNLAVTVVSGPSKPE